MPVNKTGQTRRWLRQAKCVCVLYETDAGFHRTLCGKITTDGTIEHGTTKAMKPKCRRCAAMIQRSGLEN